MVRVRGIGWVLGPNITFSLSLSLSPILSPTLSVTFSLGGSLPHPLRRNVNNGKWERSSIAPLKAASPDPNPKGLGTEGQGLTGVATSESPASITISMLHSLSASHNPDAAPLPPWCMYGNMPIYGYNT